MLMDVDDAGMLRYGCESGMIVHGTWRQKPEKQQGQSPMARTDRLQIHVIDTHTGGEPTRVVLRGGPDLGRGPLTEQRNRFRTEFDRYRSAIVNEPRGSDVMVGAMLTTPTNPRCAAGVIFFNNVGYLGMCGHGTMGVAVALAHAGLIAAGTHLIETPVGEIEFHLDGRNRVTLENVPSYRHSTDVVIDVAGSSEIHGDVAWGGNWFYLTEHLPCPIDLAHVGQLTNYAQAIRQSLAKSGITGADGAEIDHVEIFGPPSSPQYQGRSFVLCPGGAYDRSPCGTGTSAKLACLAAEGKLSPGELWRQESVIGSVFEARYRTEGDRIVPSISGAAYVNGEATLLFDHEDPFCWGIH
jgi:4-hydroxyproline epimerase